MVRVAGVSCVRGMDFTERVAGGVSEGIGLLKLTKCLNLVAKLSRYCFNVPIVSQSCLNLVDI